jgi:hypothetical protein
MKAEDREDRNANKSAEGKTGRENEKSAQKEGREDQKNAKSEGRENEKNARGEGRENEKNARGESRENEKNAQTEGKRENMQAQGREGREGRDMNAQGRSETNTTVGQAGAGAKLSTEQRTKITTVIRNEHVTPVTNVDFSLSVGTRVPRDRVHLVALPSEVVTIYPEWRGYEFFMVGDKIVVVDPRTLEIVDVLEA